MLSCTNDQQSQQTPQVNSSKTVELSLCGATGVALLNAIGNALVGFFMVTKFDSHSDRMKEVDKWCSELRKEIDVAYDKTADH